MPEGIGWVAEPMRLLEGEPRADGRVHRLYGATAAPVEILEHPEIRILLATYKRHLHLIGAELQLVGTSCSYKTPPGTRLLDNSLLPFVRGEECSAIPDTITGELKLTVRIRGRGAVAAWTFLPPMGQTDPRWIVVSQPGSESAETRPILRGSYVDYQPPTTVKRVELLNHMWQLSPSTRWLWLLLFCAFCLALTGILLFPLHRLSDPDGRPQLSSLLRGAVGSSCLAAALGATYAVLTPPLMAPDEPFHLLGFAALNESPLMFSETETWTRLIHLNRIRFHGPEHFRPEDIGSPWPEADPYLGAVMVDARNRGAAVVQARSSIATTYWKTAGQHLQNQSVQHTLIAVRLMNVLIFGLAVGVATALGIACTTVSYPQLLCFPFLFVPTLPFFAMHVSDYAVLCAVYVILAGSLGVLFLDGPRSHWVGFPLGLSAALMLTGSRSALPLVAVIAVALGARLLLGSRRSIAPGRAAAIFWIGFALGASSFYVLADQVQLNALVAGFPARLSDGPRRWFLWLAGRPWATVGFTLLAALSETTFATVRSRSGSCITHRAARLVAPLMVALVSAVGLSMLGSLVTAYPHVAMIQLFDRAALISNPPSMSEYTQQVITTALTVFRLREPDLYLYSSFFGGFGWFDTVPSPSFLTALAVLMAASSVVLALQLARATDVRRVMWLFALLTGCGASLALYAMSCYAVPVNLHGRYLIGWYLCWLSITFSPLAVAGAPSGRPFDVSGVRRPSVARTTIALLLCGLIHVYCLHFILLRYF